MLTVLNYILILTAAAVSISGLINGAGEALGTFGFAGLVLPLAALALILWKVLGSSPAGGREFGIHWFFWPVVLVLASRTLFPSDGFQAVYAMVLTVAVLLPALVRPQPVWIIAFAFTMAAYSAQLAVEQRVWAPEPFFEAMTFYIDLLLFAVVSFIFGLVPWWILKKRAEAQERQFNETLEEVRNNAITDAMARTRELAQDQPKKSSNNAAAAAVSTGTLKFDSGADTLTLLTEGGDEVNQQLKSMLFFIRYNVKGLTASAFIYDAQSRSLVLNCYDTKGGTSVREGTRIPYGAGVIGQAATDRNVFVSGDMSLYQNSEHNYYVQDPGVYSLMAAPVRTEGADKELLGVLVVDSPNRNAFSDHDKEIMKRFASIAAALIVNIKMSLSLDQSEKMFRVFYKVSHHFSNALKMEDIFSVLVEWVPKTVPSCTRLVVVLHDQANNVLRLHLVAGAREELAEGMEFSPDSGGIYSYVFNNSRPVNIPDMQVQRAYRFSPGETPSQTTRSLLVLPIIVGEDHRCVGLFSVEGSVPELFKPMVEQFLTTVTENASVAIARSLLYLKMEKLATTDGLTGLNNHRTFQEIMARELERARRYGRPLSLLLTDIDHFKSFNDTYGHPVGDLVLREIAGCIRNAVRINDFPARYGGEEFAVILPETPEQGAYIIAERIRQMVEAKVIDSGPNKLRVTISIGFVTFPTYGQTQQEIIDFSDKALYTSKKTGRNRVTMYDPTMTVSSK
jgi:diguanylate cyclase (GGDEF)-like protein